MAVVVGAQQHELVESGVVADLVGDGVVGVAPAGGGVAAGEHAAAVSFVEDGAFAAGGVASGVGGAEDGAVAVEVEADQQVGDAGVAEGFFGGGAGQGGAGVGEGAVAAGQGGEVGDGCAQQVIGVPAQRHIGAGLGGAGLVGGAGGGERDEGVGAAGGTGPGVVRCYGAGADLVVDPVLEVLRQRGAGGGVEVPGEVPASLEGFRAGEGVA